MGIVMANAAMSLDGFIAGPNHEMDWVFDHHFLPDGPTDVVDGIIASTGAILSGRGSYEVGQRSAREETSSAFGGRWSGAEFVLTHRPPARPRAGLGFLSGDISAAVATAREAAAGRNLLVLGADVTRQCLEADLIDEIVLLVLPIVLGDGIRLFGSSRYCEKLFEVVSTRQVGQVSALHFRRRR
jgi:dihydrofolate reductase